MLEELLAQNEGKTIEFKENTGGPLKIIKTVVAFANTSGGTIVIGIEDKTKKVVGVDHVLFEKERITNLICDAILPMLVPDIDIVSYSGKELLLIHVPHLAGPFYWKKAGIDRGVFVRLGSSNRQADPETLASLQRLAKRISFDEMPCVSAGIKELDKKLIYQKLKGVFNNITEKHYQSLGLVGLHNKKKYVTYGGLLMFGVDRLKWLPDAFVKCVAFADKQKRNISDKREIKLSLIDSVDEVINFIRRNTRIFSEIGPVRRIDIPEYPPEVIREAVINAIVHADYSIKGASIQISIYNNRIEITNPGGLPFGQTMHSALSGVSKMRNSVIGRIFRELGIIETLGMGMQSILRTYEALSVKLPKFEEIDHFFKVTLYARIFIQLEDEPWINKLQGVFLTTEKVSTSEMAKIWGVTVRTARTRLNKLLEKGYLKRNAQSKHDPHATYSKK